MKIPCVGVASVLLLCVFRGDALGESKPVALVGSGSMGRPDRRFFEYYVTAHLGVVSDDRGEFLDPKEFGKYSMVAWLRGCAQAFTAEQVAAAKAYVESGGHLLMTSGAIVGAFGRPFTGIPWLGGSTWAYAKNGWKAEVLQKDDPSLTGVETQNAAWMAGPYALLKPSGVNVLGKRGEFTTLGYVKLGSGRLIFSTYGPYDCRDENTKAHVMRIYRNLVSEARPLTEAAQAETLLAAAAPGRKLAIWRRDWDGSTESRLLWKPCGPRAEDRVASLDFASAREEIDTAFVCVQSREDVGEVHLEWDALRSAGGRESSAGALRVFVMGQEPEVAINPPSSYKKVDRSRRGPFFLIPADKLTFNLPRFEPRTVWFQVNTRGLAAGSYISRVRFVAAGGESLAELPVRVEVAPVLMPDPRIVQLRTWGGSIGADPRLVSEMGRQRCDEGVVSYPDTQKVRLRNSDVSLHDVFRSRGKVLQGQNRPPRLDFTAQWNEMLDRYLDHGVTFLALKDTRTGRSWADAITGKKCDVTEPYEQWPEDWRAAYVDYYAQLREYLSDIGFYTAYPIWTDEPGYTTIRKEYLPRAKAYCAAGLGPGSTWTTPGWMTAEDVNSFAPWTRDFGMYQYGYPNLQRFLREGQVKLPPHSEVGFTRGGTGLAVRFPHPKSRIQGWWVVRQGPPAHFVRTGPIWKGWLYYVDFTAGSWFRLGGVHGERLLAYGSADLKDLSAEMLTSSDWEGARDGIDDANLARMVEWYLPRLKSRAEGAWLARLKQIEAERALWFTERSPFPIGQREVHYHHEPKDGPVLDYRYQEATAESTQAIESGKRYMLGLLKEMAPHVTSGDVQLEWQDWTLAVDGQPKITVVHSPVSACARDAAVRLVEEIRRRCGMTLPLRATDDLASVSGQKLLVGVAADAPVKALLKDADVQLDERYPGKSGYRIRRMADRQLIALVAVDEAGLARAVHNWLACVRPLGHWLAVRQDTRTQ